jgi:hypothetical protein
MKITVGSRLRSAVCSTEVIVVRAPNKEIDLRCGGHPMRSGTEPSLEATEPETGHDKGSELGKRYADNGIGLELLVTKAGTGSLALANESLSQVAPRQLPTSD